MGIGIGPRWLWCSHSVKICLGILFPDLKHSSVHSVTILQSWVWKGLRLFPQGHVDSIKHEDESERKEYEETGIYSRNYWVPERSITSKSDTSPDQLQAINTYMSFDVRESIKQIELSRHGWNPWFWIKRVVKYQIQLELLVALGEFYNLANHMIIQSSWENIDSWAHLFLPPHSFLFLFSEPLH